MNLNPKDPLPYLIAATIAAAILFVAMQTHAAPGTISATVCTIVPISGTDGFGCMDCGNGCIFKTNPNTDGVPVQNFIILDTGAP